MEEGFSRVAEIGKGTTVARRIRQRLEERYDIVGKGVRAVSALLKEKVQTGSKKIRNFENSQLKARQNNLFRNNRSQLYKELGKTNVHEIMKCQIQCRQPNFGGISGQMRRTTTEMLVG